jgi:hypothetical protein
LLKAFDQFMPIARAGHLLSGFMIKTKQSNAPTETVPLDLSGPTPRIKNAIRWTPELRYA